MLLHAVRNFSCSLFLNCTADRVRNLSSLLLCDESACSIGYALRLRFVHDTACPIRNSLNHFFWHHSCDLIWNFCDDGFRHHLRDCHGALLSNDLRYHNCVWHLLLGNSRTPDSTTDRTRRGLSHAEPWAARTRNQSRQDRPRNAMLLSNPAASHSANTAGSSFRLHHCVAAFTLNGLLNGLHYDPSTLPLLGFANRLHDCVLAFTNVVVPYLSLNRVITISKPGLPDGVLHTIGLFTICGMRDWSTYGIRFLTTGRFRHRPITGLFDIFTNRSINGPSCCVLFRFVHRVAYRSVTRFRRDAARGVAARRIAGRRRATRIRRNSTESAECAWQIQCKDDGKK